MNRFLLIFLFILINVNLEAKQRDVIKLHKTPDQLIDESFIKKLNLDTDSENLDLTITEEEVDLQEEIDIQKEDTDLISEQDQEVTTENDINLSDLWLQFSKEELIFLLKNTYNINSPILKNELLSILIDNDAANNNVDFEDFNKLIIDTLLNLGDRKRSYELIQSFGEITNKDIVNFYTEFNLNYLLSTDKISEACEYRKEINDIHLVSSNNFYLELDIFCLALQEKFDEANLLNGVLNENLNQQDKYFQFLLDVMQGISAPNISTKLEINEDKIFLYSAMHQILNIPLSNQFLLLDPINLSMPIVLSNSTNIQLRLKAAHIAFFNKKLNIDSLSALYQAVDFTYDELNNPSKILPSLNKNIEKGMAYFYQLINIQILPISRLEAIFKFWEFAEKNNLELIAFELSLKNLNTIQPSNELALYGSEIAKAYIYNKNFEMANKWLIFSESSLEDKKLLYKINSSKLLYNLLKIENSENLSYTLFDNLKFMNNSLIDRSNPNFIMQNEILYLIFSALDKENVNLFNVEKKIDEERQMPSLFIIDKIRQAIINKNNPNLLLSIIVSLGEKTWKEIHPEHFRLILSGLKQYKNSKILNQILLEILKQSNII
jgi:hypothetical protein